MFFAVTQREVTKKAEKSFADLMIKERINIPLIGPVVVEKF